MRKTLLITFITGIFVLLSSQGFADEIIATVNGKKITKSELDAYINYRQKTSKQKVDNPEAIVNEMINRELLFSEAQKKKIDQNKDVKYILEQQKRDIYIQALISKSDVAKPVDDAELKKLYNENIKTQKLMEYNVKHILMKTEAEAKTVIAELDGGAVFEDVAKSKSSGPSAKEGGSIGWVNSAQLKQMPSFAQAVADMKKGSYSKNPVKTTYGWHVIKLEDSRKLEPPAFDKVKAQIANAVRQQRLQTYVSRIREKAKIDLRVK